MLKKDDLNNEFKMSQYKEMRGKFLSFFVKKDYIYPSLGAIESLYEIYDPVIALPSTDLCSLLIDLIDFKSQEEGKGETLWRAITIKKQYTIDPLYRWIESKYKDSIAEVRNNLSIASE